ncbi:Cache 3/Cache 2 fusion domain-containing protein [Bradyrhizobium sp. ARR65]|uniref:Cache 3/Cache 2 fusion domain-containing protein n=1 Tax=Bradyrhizobium sp. ARR65 TaxID=1040989 RepID=UPI0024BF74BE|nr:Cache 3/Cache 2 fusion domain-containing protein [Bradyrhizobium sp. ARR65]
MHKEITTSHSGHPLLSLAKPGRDTTFLIFSSSCCRLCGCYLRFTQAQGPATIFVKSGDDYVRVATNVKKDDGSRAIGTILDPKRKASESIRKDEAFYGEADILGELYITRYKPIRDSSKNVIGIYYAGYLK